MIELIGLIVGLVIGCFLPLACAQPFKPLCGHRPAGRPGLRAGRHERPDPRKPSSSPIFLWLFSATPLSRLPGLAGDKLGLPLYLAAVLVFGTRLFQNFAEIRGTLDLAPKGG